MSKITTFLLACVFLCAREVFAWGGPEHTAITSAALRVLQPEILRFLGYEAIRLVRVYCQFPDFNWAVFGTCSFHPEKKTSVRIPDNRRDWNAPFYCQFDQFTGRGSYYMHGPRIGIDKLPVPDQKVLESIKAGRYGSEAVKFFFKKAHETLAAGNFSDGIRFAGVALHYLQDNTPPPHVLAIEGTLSLHHKMEALENRSLIDITGYRPGYLAASAVEAAEEALRLATDNSLAAREIAYGVKEAVEREDMEKAERLKAGCAGISAKATADILTTLYSLVRKNLPVLQATPQGVNLLKNSSFEEDADGDGLPDGWVREWYDTASCCDVHMWDRVTPRSGKACVKLYQLPEEGGAWRTCRASAIPVNPGEKYSLEGWVRTENAAGESYIALMLSDAEMNTEEVAGEKVRGTDGWRKLSVSCEIPPHIVDIRAACISRDNPGAVLFDDMELRRIS